MDHEALNRLDRLIWVTVAMVAVVVLAAPLMSRFQIAWHTFLTPALTCAMQCAPLSVQRICRFLAIR